MSSLVNKHTRSALIRSFPEVYVADINAVLAEYPNLADASSELLRRLDAKTVRVKLTIAQRRAEEAARVAKANALQEQYDTAFTAWKAGDIGAADFLVEIQEYMTSRGYSYRPMQEFTTKRLIVDVNAKRYYMATVTTSPSFDGTKAKIEPEPEPEPEPESTIAEPKPVNRERLEFMLKNQFCYFNNPSHLPGGWNVINHWTKLLDVLATVDLKEQYKILFNPQRRRAFLVELNKNIPLVWKRINGSKRIFTWNQCLDKLSKMSPDDVAAILA